MAEMVLSSEEIYKGRIVHLHVDTVRLANGNEAKREIVSHGGAVCIVPVLEDGTVLLVKQFRLAAGKVLLEIPAGTLEKDENPDDCALRELEEETGYKAAHIRPLFTMFLAPGYSTELIHAYLATGLTKTQTHFDEGEDLELIPMSLEEAEQLVLSGQVQDAKTIASLLVARRAL